MAHVFISYSRKDTDFVNRLERDLQQRGISTWRDIHSIPGGAQWFRRIKAGIDASYTMLYIDTQHAELSQWVEKEFLYAAARGLPIIPVKLDEKFMSLHAINLNPIICDDTHYDAGVGKIVAALNELPQQSVVAGAQPPKADAPAPASDSTTEIQDYLTWLLIRLKADLRDSLYVNLSAQTTRKPLVSIFELGEDDDFGRVVLERINGEHFDQGGETVEDARTTLSEHRRVILLGDPGAGKTTTLMQLAVDLARAAQADPANAKLPVFAPLRQFNGELPFAEFVEKQTYNLQDVFADLLKSGRLILLCDALNEMPRHAPDARDLVGEVRGTLRNLTDWVVSCRVRDYQEELFELKNAAKVRLQPLDPPRIYEFIKRGFAAEGKPEQGEALWQAIYGSNGLLRTWQAFFEAGEAEAFWQFGSRPDSVPQVYETIHESPGYFFGISDNSRHYMLYDPRRMMHLCRNPYMTNRVCLLYSLNGKLPDNRGVLFATFVDTLLKREEKASQAVGTEWLGVTFIRKGLAHIAYQMGRETEMPHTQANEILSHQLVGVDHGLLLRLAQAANLLDVGENVRFTHQLLQEYFASEVLGAEIDAGTDPAKIWQPDSWWQPSGREETILILAGVRGDPEAIARWVAPAQPDFAFQILNDSGISIDLQQLENSTRSALIAGAQSKTKESVAYGRAAAYRVLGHMNADDRPGLTVDDIIWCDIEPGEFIARVDEEKHQIFHIERPYAMSKYLVTNAQFAPFIADGGYKTRRFWTKIGWEVKESENWSKPKEWHNPRFNIPNHPVVGVSWHEAYAYTLWLTEYLNMQSTTDGETRQATSPMIIVSLPTELEWERAFRHKEGWGYPWGNTSAEDKCNHWNLAPRRIDQPSAVGIFPDGDSLEGISDLVCNVNEWCLDLHKGTGYEDAKLGIIDPAKLVPLWQLGLSKTNSEDATTQIAGVTRGGSWGSGTNFTRYTDNRGLNDRSYLVGFRVVRYLIE